jgi:hypothetical protein
MTDFVDALAALIREDYAAAAPLIEADPDDVRDTADRHGVLPLAAHRLAHWDLAPRPLRSTLMVEARRRAVADLVRARELRQCLETLHDAGVSVLLMKGAQLAYTHYERPDLRPRVDTDVLIPASARHTIGPVLARCGHLPAGQVPGELVMYQQAYTRERHGATIHTLDVHWRTANPQVFGAVLPYEELADAAVRVPRLGPHARGLSPAHALLLACVHRAAHHFDAAYLIWLYDIHLIAARFVESEWVQLLASARERGVATVCARGLEQAARYFHTAIPPSVSAALRRDSQRPEETATAAYLTHRRRHVEHVVSDLRALPTWADRWRLIREHLFPARQYMRDVYAPASGVPLPLLYVQRAVRGARKWLARAQ